MIKISDQIASNECGYLLYAMHCIREENGGSVLGNRYLIFKRKDGTVIELNGCRKHYYTNHSQKENIYYMLSNVMMKELNIPLEIERVVP